MECTVCKSPASITCETCGKSSYCSKKHLKLDKKAHESICYPFKVLEKSPGSAETDEFVATRDLRQGELIFLDTPFFIAPGFGIFYTSSDFPIKNICVGCYRGLNKNTVRKCKHCTISVCNDKCANAYWHKNYECTLPEVMKKMDVMDIKPPMAYYYIAVIRFLLLKKSEPTIWDSLEPQFAYFRTFLSTKQFADSKINAATIKKLFKGVSRSDVPIGKVVDALAVLARNGLPTLSSKDLYCTAVYKMARIIPHKCKPNTAFSHSFDSTGLLELKQFACVDIPRGTSLSQALDNSLPWTGTERRRLKMELCFNIKCYCERCKDPTEFGSYFSVRKCSSITCAGYMVPIIPTGTGKTNWVCETCGNFLPFNEVLVRADLGKYEMDLLFSTIAKRSWIKQSYVEMIGRIERNIESQELYLHKNHYLIFDSYELLLGEIALAFETFNDTMKLHCAKRTVEVCTQMLLISNSIMPGFSPFRGRILFYLSRAVKYYANRFIRTPNTKIGTFGTGIFQILDKFQREALKMLRSFSQASPGVFISNEKMIKILEEEIEDTEFLPFTFLFGEN